MLDSLLAIGGLVLLRDSVEWEGRSLLKALIKKSALRGEQVHVLGCEVSEEEFREGFDSDVNSRLVYHDLFRDPLNWSKPGEAVPEGPLKALRSMCKRTDHGSVTIALDSLSWLLCHIPCVTLCQALHALSQQNGDPGDNSLVEQVDPTAHLTFNLHLSKKEREARDSLTLPFQFSSEKQKALLHPVPSRTTGHIFYEPDAFDDVDPEDPDDDLDI